MSAKVIQQAGTRLSAAEVCRRNGWAPGTHIAGDEGYGVTVIRITAVGEENIYAVTVSHKGEEVSWRESNWTLRYREWTEVQP